MGEALRMTDEATRSLTLYSNVLTDPISATYVEILDALTPLSRDAGSLDGEDSTARETASPSVSYRRLFSLLAEEAEFSPAPLVGDAWQNHLLGRILRDENAFSRKIERSSLDEIGEVVRQAVRRDLAELRILFEFNGKWLREVILRREPEARGLSPLEGFNPSRSESEISAEGRDAEMKRRFAEEREWERLLEPLAEYIENRGLGLFRDHKAFRWEADSEGGSLVGIAEPDPIRLDDLITEGEERKLLLQNTEHFLAGLPANNVLLYGDRGTGKSSTVKGLLNDYSDRGLRMIEVQKEHLSDFPRIVRLLKERRERFILFIDDLSFEEHETHYKDLKALLEGSLEARPENILLYATSNRRHLVKERFSDRIHKMEDDEIHLNDTTEEKLSLSDRFGLTITFLSPTQKVFLSIVRGIAQKRGIEYPDEDLTRRALAWATQRGSRSGRIAKQFMDHLTAELQMRRKMESPAKTTAPIE